MENGKKIFFGRNLSHLRNRMKLTQEDLANSLGISRAGVKNYELEHALNPPLELLLRVSSFFSISTDTLLTVDLSTLGELNIRQLQAGNDVYIRGGQLRILATTVDRHNNDNVELVTTRAKAGYTTGYADPEYISELPTIHLPFLTTHNKYRAFQIEGDSMHPIPEGSIVVGSYVNDWLTLKDGQAYIIATRADGIVFKIIYNHISNARALQLTSLNSAYASYNISINDVAEIWHFTHYISPQLPEPLNSTDQIMFRLSGIESKLNVRGKR